MRLIRNLTFFMAYYCQRFGGSSVLGFVVLRTAAALTQQRDLARIAFNMIMWILPQLKPGKGSEPELIPLLAQLSSIARAYSTEVRMTADREIFDVRYGLNHDVHPTCERQISYRSYRSGRVDCPKNQAPSYRA
jgi:hypothetical protein